MKLFDKIRLNLALKGKIKLKEWKDRYGDDETFVEAFVAGNECEEFQHASYRLRTDAEFIMKMVKKYPGILEYCEDVIYDRYIEDGMLIEREMNKLFFAALCCSKNVFSFKYFDSDLADAYFDCVENSVKLIDRYHGEKQTIELIGDEYNINKLLNARYDIVKFGNMFGSI